MKIFLVQRSLYGESKMITAANSYTRFNCAGQQAQTLIVLGEN